MRVPKAKSRVVMSKRLKHLDGVKDCKIGPASVESRERGNAHVTGKGAEADDSGYDDVKAQMDRFGLFF
jgi:hypothetical protein